MYQFCLKNCFLILLISLFLFIFYILSFIPFLGFFLILATLIILFLSFIHFYNKNLKNIALLFFLAIPVIYLVSMAMVYPAHGQFIKIYHVAKGVRHDWTAQIITPTILLLMITFASALISAKPHLTLKILTVTFAFIAVSIIQFGLEFKLNLSFLLPPFLR